MIEHLQPNHKSQVTACHSFSFTLHPSFSPEFPPTEDSVDSLRLRPEWDVTDERLRELKRVQRRLSAGSISTTVRKVRCGPEDQKSAAVVLCREVK